MSEDYSIVMFDGGMFDILIPPDISQLLSIYGHGLLLLVCNFCNTFVTWVIERDPKGKFKFCSLQSELGRNNLERLGLEDNLSTVVLIEPGDVVYTKYVVLPMQENVVTFIPGPMLSFQS